MREVGEIIHRCGHAVGDYGDQRRGKNHFDWALDVLLGGGRDIFKTRGNRAEEGKQKKTLLTKRSTWFNALRYYSQVHRGCVTQPGTGLMGRPE